MTLRCHADGFPAPSLAWTLNGNPTPTTFVHDISRDGSELSFSNVSKEDQGTYKCIAQNSAGMAAASAVLTIYDGKKYSITKWNSFHMMYLLLIFQQTSTSFQKEVKVQPGMSYPPSLAQGDRMLA
jgi:hypothetical protein